MTASLHPGAGLVLAALLAAGCSEAQRHENPPETRLEAGPVDASASDDAGADAGTMPDAGGDEDAAGLPDAGPAAPLPPPELVHYLSGDDDDADVMPGGPGLILMGGGRDVGAAFEWWRPLLAGGDVVILRTSGADGYNDYLYREIGGPSSVETLLVTSRALAASEYVVDRIRKAEGIFLAGGDQSTYLLSWKDTPLEDALMYAWSRGAILGGTSAGLAVLGEYVYAAYAGSVTSAEALADPHHPDVTLDRGFLSIPLLAGVLTDSHFAERDRMGRLLAFACRIHGEGWGARVLALGVGERTALTVTAAGVATVRGEGSVYVLDADAPAESCRSGTPLTYRDVTLYRLGPGETITLPSGSTPAPRSTLSAVNGVLDPADPY